MTAFLLASLHGAQRWRSHGFPSKHNFLFHRLCVCVCVCACVCVYQCKCACICIILCVDCVSNLLTHAVDTIGPQQVDSLLHQVCASAAEHTEAQILQELCFSRGSIQFPRGTEAVIRSEGQSTQSDSQCKLTVLTFCNAPYFPRTPDKLYFLTLRGGWVHGKYAHLFLLRSLKCEFVYEFTRVPAGVFFFFMCRWRGWVHTRSAAQRRALCSQPYRSWRGSQSTPGSSSLAACRTSSLSTEKLRLCSVWTTATRTHSMRGGSTMNGL